MTTKKRPLINDVSVGSPGLDLASLRTLARTYPHEFVQRMQKMIDKPLDDPERLRWSDITSLRDFFNALADVPVKVNVMLHGETRAIDSSAFPVLSGNLTVAGINDAYMAVPTIGDQLVRDYDSKKETSTIVGLLAESKSNLERKEGEPYTLVGAGEERFDIGSKPKGLRMQITQEMIDRNDIENVVQRVEFLGEVPAEEIEEQTLKEVTDHDGSAASGANYVLNMNKAGSALYSATANAPGSRAPNGTRITNNALTSVDNLEKARRRLATMLNSRNKVISMPVSEMILLTPDGLNLTAEVLLGSIMLPGVQNELNAWGPQGSRRPTPLSSSKLDALSPTAWYLGAFKRQFRRKWGLRIETVTMTGNISDYLRNRIAFEARVGWDCKVGATDYVWVVENLSGTTAPKDEVGS